MSKPLPLRGPLLLDGGLATELEARGHDLNHALWSARLLLENPQAIIEAHLAYLRSGAQCIISASYQASITGFKRLGLSRAEAEDTLLSSVSLARQAVAQFCQEASPVSSPLVAASIGPYGASLADGSEYRGDYAVSAGDLMDFHAERLALLSASDADLLACETIPGLSEARVLNKLLAQQDKPAWVSYSCRDGTHLNDGHLLAEAIDLLECNDSVLAQGVNCTAPRFIGELIRVIKARTRKAIVVYPNSGEHYDATAKAWHGECDPLGFAAQALEWRAAGATIIGGCCRVGPPHISALQAALAEGRALSERRY